MKISKKPELPYDPAIPLLGIYPDKTIIRKDTCTPMFTAALFAIVNTWKQPKWPSAEEWIKKIQYIQTVEHYPSIKEEQNNVIFNNMNGPRDYHTKQSKSKRKTNIIWYHLYVKSKTRHKWTYLWNRKKQTDIQNRLVVAKGKRSWGKDWELGISRYKVSLIHRHIGVD